MPNGGRLGRRTDAGREGQERHLENQAATWPSPDANLFHDGFDLTPEEWDARRQRLKENCPTPNGNGCGTPLAMAAQLWGTPRGSDGEKGGPNQSFGAGGVPLAAQTADWATATVRDYKGGAEWGNRKRDGFPRKPSDMTLADQAEVFPSSPPAPSTPGGGQSSTDSLSSLLRYRRWLYARLGVPWEEKATDAETLKANPVRLNPAFACWLMGWGPFSTGLTASGLTSCGGSAMESWNCKPRWLLQSFCAALGLGG